MMAHKWGRVVSLGAVVGYLYVIAAFGLLVGPSLAAVLLLGWTLTEILALQVATQVTFALSFYAGYKLLLTAIETDAFNL